MEITIIQLGKDKDSWLKEAIQEYLKRIKPFCKLNIVQLNDTSIKTAGTPENVAVREGKNVLAKVNPSDYLILLDEKGEQKSSLEFSTFLTNISSVRSIVFVIGGVFGSSKELKERADFCLSMSRLTFTHRITRLILVEQIYRAMMILNNRQYHVE